MTENILSVKGLKVIRGKKQILEVPSLDINKGEFLAVTGPNGAGKSTLLKVLSFLEPFSGHITFQGRSIDNSAQLLQARRCMAMVFQDPLLLRGSVKYNVETGLKLRGTPKRVMSERVNYWMAKLKISHLVNRDISNLSGGEAQRVSLVRALVLEPEVLFLDEPFSSLDTPTKADLISELKGILAETGTTTLLVTHDLSDLPYLADRMLVMTDGAVRQTGPVDQVLSKPVDIEVARFLGVENIWTGTATNSRQGNYVFSAGEEQLLELTYPSGIWAVPGGTCPALACIRPEHVAVWSPVLPRPAAVIDDTNVFSGLVEAIYPFGYYYKLKLKLKGGVTVTALAPASYFPSLPCKEESINIWIPPEKIHVIPTKTNTL